MKRLATVPSMVLAVLALGWGLTATASALPEQHVELGEAYPVKGEGTLKGASVMTLSTPILAPVSASEAKLLIECTKLGSLCPYDKHFTGAEFGGKKCHTAGDADGVILVTKNEVHLVSTSTVPLDLVGDFLVAKYTIICVKGTDELKITDEGEVLAKIEGVTSGLETTSATVNQKCTKPSNGKQEVKEYLNGEGKLVKGVLKANLGLGNETACEELKDPLALSFDKMISFLF